MTARNLPIARPPLVGPPIVGPDAPPARMVRYLSHPQVAIDPQIPVTCWHLNAQGLARTQRLARSLARPEPEKAPGPATASPAAPRPAPGLAATRRVIASDETKAIETATPLARALGLRPEIRTGLHENDRSATGFLPPAEFESLADQFFAQPETSIRGWERARDAQARILSQVASCLAEDASGGDILFIGHGGVGTLLYCALAGLAIDRCHDQGPGGGGNVFAFPIETGPKGQVRPGRPLSAWQPMESLA